MRGAGGDSQGSGEGGDPPPCQLFIHSLNIHTSNTIFCARAVLKVLQKQQGIKQIKSLPSWSPLPHSAGNEGGTGEQIKQIRSKLDDGDK